MNEKQKHFLKVWQSSPSLKVAAETLGMRIRSVAQQANRLRIMGFELRTLTDQRFNRHTSKREKRALTSEEQMFMAQNYEFARRMAERTCSSMTLPPQWAGEMVEDAATEALLLIARRSTEPGFVTETAKGLIITAVRCQIFALLKRLLGPVRASPIIVEIAPSHSPSPLQEVITREEHPRQAYENEAAGELIGALPDTRHRKESVAKKECLSLRMKARELGLCRTGTTDELRERLAAHYRDQLVLPGLSDEHRRERVAEHKRPVEQENKVAPSAKSPSRIGQYLAPPRPSKSQEQIEAERFLYAWYGSSTATEVAQRLGRKVRSVTSFAGYLRAQGVPLKKMPTHCGSLVRRTLTIRPSAN